MNSLSDEYVRELLKGAIPMPPAEAPHREIWPAVRRRIHDAPHPPLSVDYALIAAVVLLCLLRPSVIGFLLLHL
jgi:hypothetical protein